MYKRLAQGYTAFCAVFLLTQGLSTLLARLIPAVDRYMPALLATTQMMPAHSVLHILTAVAAAGALWQGALAVRYFSLWFGLFYVLLGAGGAATGHPLGLGLQHFDHPFHVLLGGLGIAAYVLTRQTTRTETQ